MRTKCLVIALLTIVPASQAPAQGVDTETIDQLTARALKHLTTMSRYSYKEGMYGDIEFGKNFGHTTRSGYFGENTGVMRSTVVGIDPKTEDKYGLWVNGDQLIFTKRGENGGTVIHRHHVPWANATDASHFAAFYGYMGLRHFFLPTSAHKYTLSLNPDSLPTREQYATTAVSEVTHRGRPCIKVVQQLGTKGNQPVDSLTTEYYLDKEHGMVLTKRQKKMYNIPKGTTARTLLDVDQLTEITYGPPTENGLPFPTAVKGWFVWPNGRREPMIDLTFTEFRRYKPTADELDFEKQFGIPLPALPPRPGSPAAGGGARISRWLIGGLVFTAMAAAVVYVRRRAASRGQRDTREAERAI
jgi:hypothetical protein